MSYPAPHARAPFDDRGTSAFLLVRLATILASAALLSLATPARAQNAVDGPVTELAIRLVSAPLDTFTTAREAFIAALVEQDGVGTDREFVAILDGRTFEPPAAATYVGMTQYGDAASFAEAGEALAAGPEAQAFFGTFTPLVFTALRPLDAADAYDLAGIADQSGQVLEIAVRDLSTFADFDTTDYDARRLAFLDVLSSMPGVVDEYQWVSILDPNIVVGMTVYESAEAFESLAGDAALLEVAMPFLQKYPAFAGYIVVDAR